MFVRIQWPKGNTWLEKGKHCQQMLGEIHPLAAEQNSSEDFNLSHNINDCCEWERGIINEQGKTFGQGRAITLSDIDFMI